MLQITKLKNIDVIPYLINQGAFQEVSRLGGKRVNIDLSNNPINYTTVSNIKVKDYIENNVNVVKL